MAGDDSRREVGAEDLSWDVGSGESPKSFQHSLTLTLPLSHTHSLPLSPSLSPTLSLTLYHSLSDTPSHSLSLSLTLSLSRTLSHSLTHSLSLSHSLTLSLFIVHSCATVRELDKQPNNDHARLCLPKQATTARKTRQAHSRAAARPRRGPTPQPRRALSRTSLGVGSDGGLPAQLVLAAPTAVARELLQARPWLHRRASTAALIDHLVDELSLRILCKFRHLTHLRDLSLHHPRHYDQLVDVHDSQPGSAARLLGGCYTGLRASRNRTLGFKIGFRRALVQRHHRPEQV